MAEDTICGTARGSSEVPLSILELAVVGSGVTPTETLEASTELARRAEEWGYHRIWVAEHHGMPSVASSSPAVLIAHLAAATRSIRLGSGGVMLPNHAPLIVAEQFGTLHALHPGRIDLGLGRAPGTDPATARALRRNGPDADDFPEQLAELTAFLDGSFPQGHSLERVVAVPRSPSRAARRSGCWAPAVSAPSSPACSACRSRSRTTSAGTTPSPPWSCTGRPSGPPPSSAGHTR